MPAMISFFVLFSACTWLAASEAVHTGSSPPLRVAPDDPAIFYSPYNWHLNRSSSTASTINAGAYFRFLFTGASVSLTFDVSHMVNPPSQLYWRIDNGPRTGALVAPTLVLPVPANTSVGDVPWHTLEVLVKSTTETANRWATGVDSTRVIFTGLVLSGQVAPWLPSNVNVLIYGDSITEGVLTLGSSQHYDTDHNDASVVYSFAQGALLGAEVGVVGFGATGLSRGGSGGVPALGESWDMMWAGVPRSFSPRPDLVVFNEGTNDGANDITAAFAAVLDDVLAACPGTPIAVLLPFNGAQRAHLVAAIAACANPARVHFIDTAGFYNTSFGGGLHPTGPNDVARVAPQIAAQLRPLIAPPPAPAPLEHAPVIAAAKKHKRAANKRSLRA